MTKKTFINMRYIFPVMILIITASCGQGNKKAFQEYVGTYKTSDETSNCSIVLTVTSLKDGLHYAIKTNTREQGGRLEVTKSDSDVYLNFVGLLGSAPKEEVSGQYIDNKIVIQNYGNSMNQYILFSECDMKYIELLKQ